MSQTKSRSFRNLHSSWSLFSNFYRIVTLNCKDQTCPPNLKVSKIWILLHDFHFGQIWATLKRKNIATKIKKVSIDNDYKLPLICYASWFKPSKYTFKLKFHIQSHWQSRASRLEISKKCHIVYSLLVICRTSKTMIL